MKRNLIAIMLLAAMTLSMLAACGGEAKPSAAPGETKADDPSFDGWAPTIQRLSNHFFQRSDSAYAAASFSTTPPVPAVPLPSRTSVDCVTSVPPVYVFDPENAISPVHFHSSTESPDTTPENLPRTPAPRALSRTGA